MAESLSSIYGQSAESRRPKKEQGTNPRAERERVCALSLGFLMGSLDKNPEKLPVTVRKSLITDPKTQTFMGSIKSLSQQPEKERLAIVNSLVENLERLSRFDSKAIPTIESQIVKMLDELRKKGQDLPDVIRNLYSKANLPIPKKYLNSS